MDLYGNLLDTTGSQINSTRNRLLLLLELLARSTGPQTPKAANAIDYPLEFGIKTLLLKPPHA